ncbi:MAG: hypothetical protein ACOC4D_01860, partial [Bacteroidota bacterium]
MNSLKMLFILLVFPLSLSAQEAGVNIPASLGPFLSWKAGLNGSETIEGRKNALAFNNLPDFGANFYYPLSESSLLGLSTDLGYLNYSYAIEDDLTGEKFTHRYSYVALNPNIFFSGFTFGFAFGLPVSASLEGSEIDTDKLDFMAEIKLGYIYPVFTDETGTMNIYINAGYMLSGLYKDFPDDDPLAPFINAENEYVVSGNNNPR